MPVDAQEHTLEGVSRLQHKGVDTILGECLCKSISPLNKLMSLDRLRVVKKPKILVEIVNGALLNFVEMLGRILVNQGLKACPSTALLYKQRGEDDGGNDDMDKSLRSLRPPLLLLKQRSLAKVNLFRLHLGSLVVCRRGGESCASGRLSICELQRHRR